ncbi:MAG: hypothetical protein JWP25_8029 [Bradyrhizobium sp.]|jgi:hypothetical protein|nr:hypothetical protein [Bradyrhizobium sp.]
MNFINLDRYFFPLTKDQEPGLDIGRFWGPRVSGWLGWEELRRRRRVILLAEAASGKTEEFRYQCEVLRAADRPSFFLRIEELAEQGTETALDSESAKLFEAWLAGSGEGWFFLDSIDEARLNRKSFDTALKRFARDIGDGRERAHVYVSCRVTDWKGADDRATYSRYLPAWKKPVVAPIAKPDDYSALLDPLFEKKDSPSEAKPDESEERLNELLVVQLVPLSADQYRTLATAAGVADVGPFVQAITKHGLEALTERPGDLLDLADYWKSHAKFGSFSEMLEHSIARKLAERDPHRPDNETISPEDAREGAERLAGALTLGKSFTLRAPGHDPDPSLAAGALDPADILPDWSDARRNALLRRGIFAPATYGRIRFHHRSTQEYLAAKWLDRLIQTGCPRTEIAQLLFAERYGVETVVPSLRAEAAWLSLWHPDIRSEVIRREPLTLVTYGDPGSLPIPVREQLLLAFASKQAAAEISEDRLDARALWMFADQQLATAVRRAWQMNARQDFRFDLLRLIREGSIKGAAPLAKSVALNKAADEYHRVVAIQAAEACGDSTTLSAVAKALVTKPEMAGPRLAGSVALVLYPKYLSTRDLLSVIEKSEPPKEFSAEGFGYQLEQFYDKAPDNAARVVLLSGLADLCLSKPFTDDFHRLAKRFKDIAKHLHDPARDEALRLGSNTPPPYFVRLLMVVERAGREGFTKQETPKLHELVRNNPQLNRALFWADAAEQRANGTHGPVLQYWQIYFSGNASLWGFSEADVRWLYADLAARSDIEDKQIALSAILNILQRAGRLAAEEATVRAAIGSEPVLVAALGVALVPPPEDPLMRAHRLRSAIHELKNKKRKAADKESWIKFRDELLKNPSLLSDPSNLSSWKAGQFRLHYVSNWLQKRTGTDTPKAALEWRLLEEGFNRAVAEAYRDGMKRLWRLVPPVRPVRKPGGVINIKYPSVLAFSGLGIEAAEDPDWALHLTEKEAAIAARHGCRAEQSYPEWLDALIISWPKAVLPVVKEQIDREWSAPSETSTIFLYRYGAPTYTIQQPVQRLIVSAILKSEANAVAIVRSFLRIVRNLELGATQRAQLFAMAKTRYAAHVKAQKDDFARSYLALLLIVDPDAALPILEKWLDGPPKAARQARAETTLTTLFDRHDPLVSGALTSASTKSLEALLHIAYSHIRPKDDTVRHGSYTPDTRDHAQNARDAILSALLARPGADAYQAMKRLAEDPVFALHSHRFRELARGKAERDAESPAWNAAEVLTFQRQFTAPAKTGADLLRVVMGVLADIAQNLIHGDVTSRPLLERAKDEDEVQHWLVEQMNARARGRFHAFREAEVAIGDKPDVIIASTSAPCEVAIEVKHGGKGWTARDLVGALRTQLAEDYLKPENRRHGVLVITHHRDRRWLRVSDNKPISFADLIAWLSGIAATITENAVGQIAVKCAGINAWKSDANPIAAKQSSKKAKPRAKRRPAAKKSQKRAVKKALRKR